VKVLVINCGSSSIKYQLLDMENEELLSKGLLEKIGINGSNLQHRKGSKKHVIEKEIKNHVEGLKLIINALVDKEIGVVSDINEIDAVGHRVVHGGKIASSLRVTDEVLKAVQDNTFLAPLHNPPNLQGIKAAKEVLPDIPHIAVFDTAYHQTMPVEAYTYAIPKELRDKYSIRRYGFHGTSHRYIGKATSDFLKKPIEELKIISCHIGNGASICAIDRGKSVDTSMGLTPLEGLIMGTRSGDIDPAIVPFLQEEEGLSPEEVSNILNKKSGMYALTNNKFLDMRDVENRALVNEPLCKTAHSIYEYRIAKYIGAYAAAMNGVDVIVFTAGVGENSPLLRRNVINKYMGYLGASVDLEKNECRGVSRDISADDASVKVLVIPTNEELMIARDTEEIVKNNLEELHLS
jgi:acetate kinase